LAGSLLLFSIFWSSAGSRKEVRSSCNGLLKKIYPVSRMDLPVTAMSSGVIRSLANA
jgi:hypothetical protein